jgi:hypothetical protein
MCFRVIFGFLLGLRRDAEVNRPGFLREVVVQNLSGNFNSAHVCMELILHFLRRSVAYGAM